MHMITMPSSRSLRRNPQKISVSLLWGRGRLRLFVLQKLCCKASVTWLFTSIMFYNVPKHTYAGIQYLNCASDIRSHERINNKERNENVTDLQKEWQKKTLKNSFGHQDVRFHWKIIRSSGRISEKQQSFILYLRLSSQILSISKSRILLRRKISKSDFTETQDTNSESS